jgi:Rad52/22 family double-strand break repair protein
MAELSVVGMQKSSSSQDQSTTNQATSPAQLEWYKEPCRPMAEILANLSKQIPRQYLDTLKDKGNAAYIPWFNACKLLDRCTGGHWEYFITNIHTTSERIFVTVRITIYALERSFSRDATGTELLKREITDRQTGELQVKELAYGDPSSNAESMALRRAAAKFGLGLYLYDK